MRLTATVRHGDYGDPADEFASTARMWSGILANQLREGEQVTAMDVPLCMIAVKLARQAHRHKRDNLVDIGSIPPRLDGSDEREPDLVRIDEPVTIPDDEIPF